jgi:hypothetical protein
MNQNKLVVCSKTKDLLIAAHRLSNSISLMEHALDFVESEISCGHTIDQSRIFTLLTTLEAFFNEDRKALLAAKNSLSKRKFICLTNNSNGGVSE